MFSTKSTVFFNFAASLTTVLTSLVLSHPCLTRPMLPRGRILKWKIKQAKISNSKLKSSQFLCVCIQILKMLVWEVTS